MAFSLSPAVSWTEKDLSTVVVGVGSTGGAFAGVFKWGPVLQRYQVNNELTLVDTFGKPDDNCFISFWTAANFLAYGTNLTVVRVVSEDAKNATADGTGLLIKNEDDYTQNYGDGEADVGLWAAKYPGALGNSLTVSMADSGNYATWAYKSYFTGSPNTSDFASNLNASNDEVHVVVIDSLGYWTGTPGSVLERYAYVSKAADAKKADGSSNFYATVINRNSPYIWWMDHPAEGWGSNASLGGTYPTLGQTLTFETTTGDFTVGEQVQVKAGTVTAVSVGAGGGSYIAAPTVVFTGGGGSGAAATAVLTGDAVSAVNITNAGSGYTSPPTVSFSGGSGTGASATATVTYTGNPVKKATVLSWDGEGGILTVAAVLGTITTSDRVVGASSTSEGIPSGVDQATSTVSLDGGVDGNDSIADGDIEQGFDMFLAEEFDCSLVMTGNASSAVQLYVIQNIAEVRRDCVAFVSPSIDSVVANHGSEVDDILTERDTLGSSSYAFMDANWKYQYDKYNDSYRWLPLNGDIAGLAVRSDEETDPWFSFAGLNRGHIKNVIKLAWNPNKAQRDSLYSKNVNPVVRFPGDGPVLFGDKTLQTKPSAFDHINVRRLFIILEKSIATAAKYTLFEFNDEFTRAQLRAIIEPFLRDVQGRRGISNFEVVCDARNNTPQVINTNQLVGDIYIIPAHSINYIQLNFVAAREGVSFDEIIGRA